MDQAAVARLQLEKELGQQFLPELFAKDFIQSYYVYWIIFAQLAISLCGVVVGFQFETMLDSDNSRHPYPALCCYLTTIFGFKYILLDTILGWRVFAMTVEEELNLYLCGHVSWVPGLTWWRSNFSLGYNGRYSLVLVVFYEWLEIGLQVASFYGLSFTRYFFMEAAFFYGSVLSLNCIVASFFIANWKGYGVGSIAAADVLFEILYTYSNYLTRGPDLGRTYQGILATTLPLVWSTDILNECIRRHFERRLTVLMVERQLVVLDVNGAARLKKQHKNRLASIILHKTTSMASVFEASNAAVASEGIEQAVENAYQSIISQRLLYVGSLSVFIIGVSWNENYVGVVLFLFSHHLSSSFLFSFHLSPSICRLYVEPTFS
jgi:hypothetical protein